MALKTQIEANDEFKEQFKKQNQDQLFFRLIDNLHGRITNFSFETKDDIDSREVKSYETLNYIINKFRNEVHYKCKFFGRQLLAEIPEKISSNFYMRIVRINKHDMFSQDDSFEHFKEELLGCNDYNERWELLKSYLKSDGNENGEVTQILKDIGSVYFYKTPLNMRFNIYQSVYHDIYADYGVFFDGYINNIKYLLNFIDKVEDKVFYIDYFKGSLTSYEKAIIFYYMASGNASKKIKSQIKEFHIIDELYLNNSFFVDVPSKVEFQKELEDILGFEGEA
jgi:hypothetical protein